MILWVCLRVVNQASNMNARCPPAPACFLPLEAKQLTLEMRCPIRKPFKKLKRNIFCTIVFRKLHLHLLISNLKNLIILCNAINSAEPISTRKYFADALFHHNFFTVEVFGINAANRFLEKEMNSFWLSNPPLRS